MSKPTYQQTHIDVPLTNISIAYRNGKYVADQIFANVPVKLISGLYTTYSKGDFLRREAAVRAPGTKAARGGYGVATALYTVKERAMAKGVPDEAQDNAFAPLNPLKDATDWATEQLMLEVESDVAGMAFGAGWSSSATPGVLWSNDTANPIKDVETAENSIVQNIGVEANTGIMGRGLWRFVKQHPEIVDRIRFGAGPNSPANVTLNAVAALFNLDKLLVGTAVENTAGEEATASMSYIWGNHMLVAYVAAAPSLQNPSAGYIVNYQTLEVTRFREEQERQDVVEVRRSWQALQTATDAGYLIKSAG